VGRMYQVVLSCFGVPASEGAQAAADITAEFANDRSWHSNVVCEWDGERLTLRAENDFDHDGLGLYDEFSDCIAAYVAGDFDYRICIDSVTQTSP